MRALWIVAVLIGIGILIFAHATVLWIVVGIAFPWTGCLLYRRAARSQDRSRSQVVPFATRFLGGSRHGNPVRPRGSELMTAWQRSRDGYSSGSTGVTVSSDWRRSTSSRSASAVCRRPRLTSLPHVKVCTSRLSYTADKRRARWSKGVPRPARSCSTQTTHDPHHRGSPELEFSSNVGSRRSTQATVISRP